MQLFMCSFARYFLVRPLCISFVLYFVMSFCMYAFSLLFRYVFLQLCIGFFMYSARLFFSQLVSQLVSQLCISLFRYVCRSFFLSLCLYGCCSFRLSFSLDLFMYFARSVFLYFVMGSLGSYLSVVSFIHPSIHSFVLSLYVQSFDHILCRSYVIQFVRYFAISLFLQFRLSVLHVCRPSVRSLCMSLFLYTVRSLVISLFRFLCHSLLIYGDRSFVRCFFSSCLF